MTWPCRSRMTRWPASLALQEGRAGHPLVQLAAVADRGEPVGGPADDGGRHPAEHLDRVELVEPLEAREEVGHHLERRLRQHAVDEVDVRRRHLVAEREQVGDDAGHRAADPPGPVDAAVAAGQGPDRAVGQLAAELGREHGQQDPARVEPAGGRRDEADADDPVADQLGVLLGEGDDRHAAHRMTDQDDRAFGHDVVEDGPEVVAELLDRRVAVGRAPGAAVRALVVVDGADQPAVGRALEVPAVEVERVAVAEDDGELARPLPEVRVELVDLDEEGDAVVGDDRHRSRAQAPERRRVALAAADGAALPADADRRAGRGQADGTGGGPEDAAAGAHRLDCLVCLRVDVPPGEPAPDPGHDLVADRAAGLGPVLGGRLAVVAGAEDGDLGPGAGVVAVEVDDELVHADPAAEPAPLRPRPGPRRGCRRPAGGRRRTRPAPGRAWSRGRRPTCGRRRPRRPPRRA